MIWLKKMNTFKYLISFVVDTDEWYRGGSLGWESLTSAFIAFNKGLPRIGKPINHSIVETSFTGGNLK